MDTLEVVKKAEQIGGEERRSAIEHLLITARDCGCDPRVGGGQAGGMNIRYGSIGYAILDVNTQGIVKLYVQPHPNKVAPDELMDALNGFIETQEELEPKSFPINSYGHLEAKIEEIPNDVLERYLRKAVELIREEYYLKHLD